ncbi:hypothetical protein [Desulfobacter latus]|uniref:DUF4381 domain-containing protein n=1 Tax=Desulfobacter latus TaxID=2292 RepID=A0A850T9B1_9BACT|nr:hypothetical protein [Desulfobacter latus]NWH05098.1 hypothetical protein [Desulfobacter latus]
MLEDIHDIRPPVMTGMDPGLIQGLLWGAGALVLCALMALIIRYRLKKRKNKTHEAQALPQLSPYETAARDLEQCMADFGHDAKIFYFELGRIVKAYISGRFQINCSEMTSQEMARAVKNLNSLDTGLKTELVQFQDQCDPIRYMPLDTQGKLDAGRMEQDLALAGSLVARIEQTIADAPAKEDTEDA